MKRILVYGMTDNNGGMEAYLLNYLRCFQRDRLLFDFVTDYPSIAWKDELEQMGCKIFYLPSRRENLVAHMRKLRKIIKENGYHIVYFNLLSASGVFTVLAAKSVRGVKTVVHSHNDRVGNMNVHKTLRPILNAVTDYRLACSDKAGSFMFSPKMYNRGKIRLIHNAIDLQKYAFSLKNRNQIREDFKMGERFTVGHVGRMCAQKNSLFLIDIFHEILKINSEALLLYVGGGEDRAAVENRVKEYGIGDNVIFTGMRSDTEKFYSAMDAFLLPSLFEGLSVSGIEAQTAGLPCYVSDEVNPKTKLTDSFYFIPLTKGPQYWAEQILKTAFGTEQRKDQTEMIRKAGYDIQHEAGKLQDFFLELS